MRKQFIVNLDFKKDIDGLGSLRGIIENAIIWHLYDNYFCKNELDYELSVELDYENLKENNHE